MGNVMAINSWVLYVLSLEASNERLKQERRNAAQPSSPTGTGARVPDKGGPVRAHHYRASTRFSRGSKSWKTPWSTAVETHPCRQMKSTPWLVIVVRWPCW
jgi:hypothetical protein